MMNSNPKLNRCKGINCESVEGMNHSPQCEAEHAASSAGGRFITETEYSNIKNMLVEAHCQIEYLDSDNHRIRQEFKRAIEEKEQLHQNFEREQIRCQAYENAYRIAYQATHQSHKTVMDNKAEADGNDNRAEAPKATKSAGPRAQSKSIADIGGQKPAESAPAKTAPTTTGKPFDQDAYAKRMREFTSVEVLDLLADELRDLPEAHGIPLYEVYKVRRAELENA